VEKYIAFLRGINVGGHNKVSMSELKRHLQQKDFHEVVTYINSGNILFSSALNDTSDLRVKVEAIILEAFELKISVMILSLDDLSTALSHAPIWWDVDETAKHNAIFVLQSADVLAVYREICDLKLASEQVELFGNVIFWSVPIEDYSAASLSKVVRAKTLEKITVRNAKTTKKMLTLG
jgi:uncharacterized protein (DUF1697 family)